MKTKINLTLLTTTLLLLLSQFLSAQNVGINNPTPHASALLDLASTGKGLLVPRMTTVQRTAIAAPATGLLVYDASLNQFWYFDGTIWRALITPTDAWTLSGNTGVTAANFIGTTNSADFIIKSNNIERGRILSAGQFGYGIALPSADIHLHNSGVGATTTFKLTNSVSGTTVADGLELRMTSAGNAEILNRENTGLYFGTASVNRVVIDNTGNVGIGTLAPTQKLHVVGGVCIQDGTQGLSKVLTSDASGNGTWQTLSAGLINAWSLLGNAGTVPGTNFLGTTDAQSLVIKTQGVERIRVLANPLGYVGINQASPAAQLDVNGKLIVGGVGYSGIVSPAANGAMIQGHTVVGKNTYAAVDVLSSYALAGERAISGYSVDSTAGFFNSTGTGHTTYMYAQGSSGSAAFLQSNNSNSSSSLRILNYGTGSGILAESYNTSLSNFAQQVQQYSVTGGGSQVLMNATTNASPGITVTHAGTGKGIQVDMNNASNASDGIRVNHSGTGAGVYINKTTVSGNGVSVSMAASSSANAIDIAHPSSSGYGMLVTRTAINAVGARIAMTNNTSVNSSIGFQIQNDSKDPNARGETIVTDSAAGLWVKQGGTNAPAPMDPIQVSIVTGGGLSVNTNFPRGSGILTSGVGHGVVAGAWDYDNSTTTDHDGGSFYVLNQAKTNAVAFSSVASYYNGTAYKIIGLGTVSTIVSDKSGNARIMAAPESPEVLFQDFGRGKLINGKAHITLDETYSYNIHVSADHPLNAFIQLLGNCNGVYVANADQFGFDVIELNNGTSNVEFSYFVSALRANEQIGGVVSDYSKRFKPVSNPALMFGNKPTQNSSSEH